jgi:hypothetical protein
LGEEVSKEEEERMRKEEEEQERVLLEGVERVQTRQFGVRSSPFALALLSSHLWTELILLR